MRLILSIVMLASLGVFAACQDSAAPTSIVPVPANSARITTTAAKPENQAEHSDEAPRISLADAKKDFDAGNALFVDTRPVAQFTAEHIKGAINIPVNEIEARYKELPKDKKIIAYCS